MKKKNLNKKETLNRMCEIAGISLNEREMISDGKIREIADKLMEYLFHNSENALNSLRYIMDSDEIDPSKYFDVQSEEYRNYTTEFENDLYQTLKRHLDKIK